MAINEYSTPELVYNVIYYFYSTLYAHKIPFNFSCTHWTLSSRQIGRNVTNTTSAETLLSVDLLTILEQSENCHSDRRLLSRPCLLSQAFQGCDRAMNPFHTTPASSKRNAHAVRREEAGVKQETRTKPAETGMLRRKQTKVTHAIRSWMPGASGSFLLTGNLCVFSYNIFVMKQQKHTDPLKGHQKDDILWPHDADLCHFHWWVTVGIIAVIRKSANRGKQITVKPVSKKQISMEAAILGLKPNFARFGLKIRISRSPLKIHTLPTPPAPHCCCYSSALQQDCCFSPKQGSSQKTGGKN